MNRPTKATPTGNDRWRTARSYISQQLLSLLIAGVALFLSWRADCVSTEQKELSRLDHLPRIVCSVGLGPDGDNLVIENTGSRVRKMTVDRLVFFDVKPCMQPCTSPARLVRYVVDDYYRDLREGDYEGSQRLTFGLSEIPGNAAFIGKISGLLQASLRPRGLDWQGIEVGRAIRVVCWDWVGTRMEECYWGEGAAGEADGFERISRRRWNQLVAVADSVRRSDRRLMSSTKTPDATAQRVVEECSTAARR
jgi:hypothetical protein